MKCVVGKLSSSLCATWKKKTKVEKEKGASVGSIKPGLSSAFNSLCVYKVFRRLLSPPSLSNLSPPSPSNHFFGNTEVLEEHFPPRNPLPFLSSHFLSTTMVASSVLGLSNSHHFSLFTVHIPYLTSSIRVFGCTSVLQQVSSLSWLFTLGSPT